MSVLQHKQKFYPLLRTLAEAKPSAVGAKLRALYGANARWRGSHPLNEMSGVDAIETNVWQPLLAALPDLERRDLIFMGGTYEGRDMVAALGHYCGTFRKNWLTIPATGRPIYIRYGEVHEIEDGLIVRSSCLWDILDVMRQAGFWPIAPSLGTEGMWPGPINANGVLLKETDPQQSAQSISQTLAMHDALGQYDDQTNAGRDGLLKMAQVKYWHPKMMWYGPSGIGTTRGLQGFVDYHQLPFRVAFPNRFGGGGWNEIQAKKEALGGGHYIRIGDGSYSVTGGWPSVYAVHLGGGFLGFAPTGREVTMRVMDFYLHDEGLIRENWVPIDIPELLLQMGIDVFDRMRSLFERGALPTD